jgi:hypothetical protein
MAQRRTAALDSGDLTGWLADIEPTATAVIKREKMRFANLHQLQLTSFVLHPRDWRGGFFDPGTKVTGDVLVEEVMQLPDDVARSSSIADWTIAFDGDQARITRIDVYSDEDSFNRAPWDEVPLRAARGKGVTIYAPTVGRWNPATYLPGAAKAAALVRSLWGKRRGVPGFVVFLADHRQFTSWFGTGADLAGAIGFTDFPRMVEADGRGRLPVPNPTVLHKPNEPSWLQRGAGSRIVLDMSQIDSLRDVQRVLAHEMGHAAGPHLIEATRADFGPKGTSNQAIWPIEGFARWIEFLDNPGYGTSAMRGVRADRAKYQPSGPFPASDDFYSTNERRTSYNYNLSSSMFLAAQQIGSKQKAIDLYVCLTNQRENESDIEILINVCINGVGLNPDQAWSTQHRLTR